MAHYRRYEREDLVICRRHLQATVSIDTPIFYAVSTEAFAFCNTSENNQGIAMLPDPKDLFRPGAYRERVAKRCEQRRFAERQAKTNELEAKAAERQAKPSGQAAARGARPPRRTEGSSVGV